jgi:hypothetical protein
VAWSSSLCRSQYNKVVGRGEAEGSQEKRSRSGFAEDVWQMESMGRGDGWKSIRMGTARTSTPCRGVERKLGRQVKQGSWDTFLFLFFSGRFIYKGWPLLNASSGQVACPLSAYHGPRISELDRQKHGFTVAYDALAEFLSVNKSREDASNRHMHMYVDMHQTPGNPRHIRHFRSSQGSSSRFGSETVHLVHATLA